MMTSREALIRGIIRAIAKGHTHNIDPAYITDFINQVQKDSPELLVAEGLQHADLLNNRQNPGPIRSRPGVRRRPQAHAEVRD